MRSSQIKWLLVHCNVSSLHWVTSSSYLCPSVPSIHPSPWYNRTGWLGVKHQLTYLLSNSIHPPWNTNTLSYFTHRQTHLHPGLHSPDEEGWSVCASLRCTCPADLSPSPGSPGPHRSGIRRADFCHDCNREKGRGTSTEYCIIHYKVHRKHHSAMTTKGFSMKLCKHV